MQADGIMLSNGPGDPAENISVIKEIRKLCEWNKETLKQVQGDHHENTATAAAIIPAKTQKPDVSISQVRTTATQLNLQVCQNLPASAL